MVLQRPLEINIKCTCLPGILTALNGGTPVMPLGLAGVPTAGTDELEPAPKGLLTEAPRSLGWGRWHSPRASRVLSMGLL